MVKKGFSVKMTFILMVILAVAIAISFTGCPDPNGTDDIIDSGNGSTPTGDTFQLVWQGSLSSAPTDGVQNGWVYYDTGSSKLWVYIENTWQELAITAITGEKGDKGDTGEKGSDGIQLVWLNDTTEPVIADEGSLYYNTAHGKAYIYLDGVWKMFAQDGKTGAKGDDATTPIFRVDPISGEIFVDTGTGETLLGIIKGPKGDKGDPGEGIIIQITINGSGVSSNDIKGAIEQAIAEAKVAGGTNDGSSEDKAFTVCFSGTGLDLDDDIAMKALFNGIAEYYVHLDLSDVSGTLFPYYSLNYSIDKSKILSVTLGQDIVAINFQAFAGFTGLKSVTAPGVLSVPNRAFSGLDNLVEISLVAATNIGEYAFSNCTSLISVNFPMANNTGRFAFENCTALTDVNFNTAIKVDYASFYGCIALTTIDLPMVTIIDHFAFLGCRNIINMNIPAVASIGGSAFQFQGYDFEEPLNTEPFTVIMGATPPEYSGGNSIFGWRMNDGITRDVIVKFPASAISAYGDVPTDDITVNWGNIFRGYQNFINLIYETY